MRTLIIDRKREMEEEGTKRRIGDDGRSTSVHSSDEGEYSSWLSSPKQKQMVVDKSRQGSGSESKRGGTHCTTLTIYRSDALVR